MLLAKQPISVDYSIYSSIPNFQRRTAKRTDGWRWEMIFQGPIRTDWIGVMIEQRSNWSLTHSDLFHGLRFQLNPVALKRGFTVVTFGHYALNHSIWPKRMSTTNKNESRRFSHDDKINGKGNQRQKIRFPREAKPKHCGLKLVESRCCKSVEREQMRAHDERAVFKELHREMNDFLYGFKL